MIFKHSISAFILSFASFSAFSFQQPVSMLSTKSVLSVSPEKKVRLHSDNSSLQRRILEQYQKWKGTHYQWGGTSHNGIDCSALVQQVLSDVENLSLPRTTGEQIRQGVLVAEYDLEVGDLVFFQTGLSTKHVGIYIGDNHFMHASTSQGVTVSNLAKSYWHSRFIAARRVTVDIS
ncbi:glycoside hydrolase [Citrobacter sp. wls710]|uniref:C40 family peptidase n=1 Tax=Citrobacter sp. wls710 TaxID=2576426 RepID=UPI0010C96016|nr:NlpC/P60 family protein [Citrobacter sp. wls710]TKU73350.1 glycoside hydrolase [Citrobacter sp. wls710]